MLGWLIKASFSGHYRGGFLGELVTAEQVGFTFVRSGDVNTNGGGAHDVGYIGYYWSRMVQSSTSVYYLYMSPTGVYPSISYYGYVGLSLRCLYPV